MGQNQSNQATGSTNRSTGMRTFVDSPKDRVRPKKSYNFTVIHVAGALGSGKSHFLKDFTEQYSGSKTVKILNLSTILNMFKAEKVRSDRPFVASEYQRKLDEFLADTPENASVKFIIWVGPNTDEGETNTFYDVGASKYKIYLVQENPQDAENQAFKSEWRKIISENPQQMYEKMVTNENQTLKKLSDQVQKLSLVRIKREMQETDKLYKDRGYTPLGLAKAETEVSNLISSNKSPIYQYQE